ncbi:hypothetical protein HMPREF9374_3886 [Desmospora sp. 8437]|nr:hypothetical protein HMPREF9374_3886 [Desmospora sp. 8437]
MQLIPQTSAFPPFGGGRFVYIQEVVPMQIFLLLLVIVIIYTAIRTFSHSIAGRRAEGWDQLKHQARMNIHMGIMFISVALMQGVSLSGGWVRLVLLILIGLLGIYNLVYGLRAWRFYKKESGT